MNKVMSQSLIGAAVLFGGCVSPDPTSSFRDVQKSLQERGAYELAWQRDQSSLDAAESFALEAVRTSLSLEDAVRIGLRNNRGLQAEYESLGISQAEVAQATRLKNPEFAGSWRMPVHGGEAVNAEYDLAQDIFDLILLPARNDIAQANHEVTKLRVAEAVINYIAQVQTAYFEVVAAQEAANRLDLIVEVNEATADVSQRQFDAGNINRLELEGELALFAQTKVEAAQARAEVRAAREELNRLMGVWGRAADWRNISGLPPIPDREQLRSELESVALSQRLDLSAARKEVELLSRSLQLKKRFRYVPGANVGINAEHELDHAWIVGPTLGLEVPLFDQGQPEVARLESEYRAAQRRLEGLAIDIRSEVRQARDKVIAARDTAEYYQKLLLPQRQRLLKESLLHYNAMQISNQALLAAKEREQLTALATIEALRDYWIARIELERACGRVLTDITSVAENSSRTNETPAATQHNH